MIYMQPVTIEPHARVVCCQLWYQMVCFLRASAFCTQPACSRFPVGVTYLSRTKSELAGSHRLMCRPDTCLGIRTHLSICAQYAHKHTHTHTRTYAHTYTLVRHYTCLSKKSRHSGFSPLKKRPEFEFTVRDYLCLCLIIHS